jgi:WD40 repeat protein
VTSVVFSLDGKYLASGCDDKEVKLWSLLENFSEIKDQTSLCA